MRRRICQTSVSSDPPSLSIHSLINSKFKHTIIPNKVHQSSPPHNRKRMVLHPRTPSNISKDQNDNPRPAIRSGIVPERQRENQKAGHSYREEAKVKRPWLDRKESLDVHWVWRILHR